MNDRTRLEGSTVRGATLERCIEYQDAAAVMAWSARESRRSMGKESFASEVAVANQLDAARYHREAWMRLARLIGVEE